MNGITFSPDGRSVFVGTHIDVHRVIYSLCNNYHCLATKNGIHKFVVLVNASLKQLCLHFLRNNKNRAAEFGWDFSRLPADITKYL